MSELENDAPMSFLQRLIGIFVAPSKTFHALHRKPSWVVPLLVIVLYIPILQIISFSSKTGQEAIRQEMMKSPRSAQMSPEQMEKALSFSKVLVPVSTLVVFPIITFALAMLTLSGALVKQAGASTPAPPAA